MNGPYAITSVLPDSKLCKHYYSRQFFSCLQNFGSGKTDVIAYSATYKDCKTRKWAYDFNQDFEFTDMANLSWKLPIKSIYWFITEGFKIVFQDWNYSLFSPIHCFHHIPWRSNKPSNLWMGHKITLIK